MPSEDNTKPASATDQSVAGATPSTGRKVGRRAFVAGVAGTAVPFLATGGLSHGFAAAPEAASPAASPAATPIAATPVPTPSPTPIPTPDTGGLTIVHDQRPVYDQSPVAGGELRLPLIVEDNSERSPIAFRQDNLILASYLDPLVWIDDVTMEPQPWLAESWEWSDDHKTITYKLREDVKWHDGSRFAARDVVFSFFVYRDDLDSAVRNFFVNMEFAEATDTYTVKVTLTSPDSNWLLNASSQFIVQRKQYTKVWTANPEGQRSLSGIDWGKELPLGTGPWKIAKIAKGVFSFERNDSYFAGPPHADTLTLTPYPGSDDMLEAWKKGELDIAWPIRANQLAGFDQAGTLYVADAASVMFAAFNFDNPARDPNTFFENLQIRQALNLAVDRGAYAAHVFNTFIDQDQAGTVSQPWATDRSVTNPARDLATARDLLEDAGFEFRAKDNLLVDDDDNRLELVAIVRNDSRPELIEVMNGLVANFAELGIKLDVQQLAPDQFRDRWVDGHDFDLIAYAFNQFPGFTDYDLYGSSWNIRINPQGWNPGGYNNAEADVAIRKYLPAKTMDEARQALFDLQATTNDQLFALWFGFPRDVVLVRPEILGFQPNKLWQTWNTRLLWRTAG